MGRDGYSQSSQLSTLVGKPVSRYTQLPKNTNTLKNLTEAKAKPNNRYHYSIYPEFQTEYQASYSQLTNLDFYSPIITILGDNPYAHLINTPFTDPGVTLDEGSTLVSNVSTVNTNAYGTFQITYVATDGINPDSTKVRIVKVGEFPVVTIDGDNPYTLERYDPYIDDEVTVDANSSVISTTSSVNNTAVGTYTVNYTVANQVFSSFHTRIVNVVDTTPPVVTILGDNPYTLERFDVYTDPGATGDLGSIVTTDLSNVQNTSIGSFVVVYNATDGNTAHDVAVTRTVNVVDTLPPVVTILGDNPYTLERFGVYTDRGATVDRGSILTTDLTAVDNTLAHGASFEVIYTGSDGNTAQDVTVTRIVNIEDSKPPQLTILGDNPYPMQPYGYFPDLDPGVEVDLGTSYSINYSNINNNNVNAGFQTVVYTASDGVHPDVVKTRIVSVADTVSPIITITGDNPYTLERYAEYVDESATVDEGSTLETTVSTVDNTTVGSYTVTYTATDNINPDTTAVRIVNVVDRTAPIVTLNGASSVTLERYGVFADIDEGVDMDANGTLVSVDTSQLDNTTQGTYTVTYNVVDDQENANVITREVVVADTVPPVVSLNNESTLYKLERYGVWADIDPGVTIDEGSYVYQINLNNTATGIQSVEYIVRDGTNETAVYRTIRVVDTVPPVITVNEPNYVHELYAQYTDPGATVDNGSILTTDTSNADVSNTTNIGTFDVIYSATDGNTAHDVTVIRTVTVRDTIAPVITLVNGDIGTTDYTVERGTTYVDPGASADTGETVIIDTTQLNMSVSGTYTVTYSATDASGNIGTSSRTVVVEDTTAPVITLIGNSSVTVERGTTYTEQGATADTGETVIITSQPQLNVDISGTYTITYTATDASGNIGTATRTVVVQDTTAPVITLVGGSFITVERGTAYNDPGASADTGETVIIDTSQLNMSSIGSYTVTYSATDAAGNTGTASRTVLVQDTIAPVITLIGNSTIYHEYGAVYTDPGANADGGEYVSINTSNVINTTVGTYMVVFSATDTSGNTGIATRNVVVYAPTSISPTGLSTGLNFGISTSTYGDTVIFGTITYDDAVHVFTGSGSTWSQQQKIASPLSGNNAFGEACSIYGDTIVVGCRLDGGSGKGAAYVYVRSGSTWSQQQKLVAPVRNNYASFGFSVSIYGDTIAVGSTGDSAVYVFTRSGTTWSQQQKLTYSGTVAIFGYSVSIYDDTIAVGDPNDSSLNGSVTVFVRSGTTWSLQQKITISNPSGISLGYSVSVYDNTIATGAVFDSSDKGATYVYTRSGSTWSQQQKLLASDGVSYDRFGHSISLNGDRVAIGARGDDSSQGSVYIFDRTGTSWSQYKKLTDPNGGANYFFGSSVALSSNYVSVGEPLRPTTGSARGHGLIWDTSNFN